LLDFTLLGSGGSMPSLKRHFSAALINFQGRKILIDCGEGTQVAMRKLHTGFKSIDLICFTHFHGDHIFGLPGLLSTISKSGRKEPITIIGPHGLNKVINGFLATMSRLPFELQLIEEPRDELYLTIENQLLTISPSRQARNKKIILTNMELDHSLPCLGYSFYIVRRPEFNLEKAMKLGIAKEHWSRLQKGEDVYIGDKLISPGEVLGKERKGIKLSYILDTRPIEGITDFVKGSDLFVCEGTYGSDDDLDKAISNKHMTFREAAELAYKAEVKKLLITHFSPAMEEPGIYAENATDIFKNTIIGYDGFRKKLSYD